MPNWCFNELKFENSDAVQQIQDFMYTSDDTKFDFEQLIPMPEDCYRGNLGPAEREQYGSNNWLDYCSQAWNTKWNASSVYYEDNVIMFDTAWSPPYPIIDALAEHFPNLPFTYTYSEEGCWFAGIKEYEHGECMYEEECEPSDLPGYEAPDDENW